MTARWQHLPGRVWEERRRVTAGAEVCALLAAAGLADVQAIGCPCWFACPWMYPHRVHSPPPYPHRTVPVGPQVGAGFYAGRIPERWLPGRFDVWLHGHQIFHVLIVVAAFIHYRAVMMLLHWRDASGGCAAHGGVGPAAGDAAAAGEGPHDILHIDQVGAHLGQGTRVPGTGGW